jgi:hypothetical protein
MLISCDPSVQRRYCVNNKSSKDIVLIFKRNHAKNRKLVVIKSNDSLLFESVNRINGILDDGLQLKSFFDTLVLRTIDSVPLKIDITNSENWKLTKQKESSEKSHGYKYIENYTITIADHNIPSQVVQKLNYIEFVHIGMEEKPVLPLIVSTTPVNTPLSKMEIHILKEGYGAKKITNKEKAIFQTAVVVDERTYLLFKNYIDTSSLVSLRNEMSTEYASFKIIEEGKLKYLNSVNSWTFFAQVGKYLKLKKCDGHLINALYFNSAGN